jgi:hypothetical protein
MASGVFLFALFTPNSDFQRVSGLQTEDWTQ